MVPFSYVVQHYIILNNISTENLLVCKLLYSMYDNNPVLLAWESDERVGATENLQIYKFQSTFMCSSENLYYIVSMFFSIGIFVLLNSL